MIRSRIVLVTDPAFGEDTVVRCVQRAASALPEGALCVQLRDKRRVRVSLRMFALRLRAVTRAAGATLVVNGDPEIARDAGADGVHLGTGSVGVAAARSTLGKGWISVAAHTDDDVARAVADGADAVLVSPVFASRPAGRPTVRKQGRGLGALRSAHAMAGSVSVFALGGVDERNARACREAGAYGVAIMKALLASDDPSRVARALYEGIAPRW